METDPRSGAQVGAQRGSPRVDRCSERRILRQVITDRLRAAGGKNFASCLISLDLSVWRLTAPSRPYSSFR